MGTIMATIIATMIDFLNIKMITIIISLSVIIIGSIIVWIFMLVKGNETQDEKDPDKPRKTTLVVLSLATLSLIFIGSIIYKGGQKGLLRTDGWQYLPLNHVIVANQNLPKGDDIPLEPNGKTLVFYKYACPACINNAEFKEELKSAKNIYWLDTTQEDSRLLAKALGVETVPAIVYIPKDKKAKAKLYNPNIYNKETDTFELDRKNMDRYFKDVKEDSNK